MEVNTSFERKETLSGNHFSVERFPLEAKGKLFPAIFLLEMYEARTTLARSSVFMSQRKEILHS